VSVRFTRFAALVLAIGLVAPLFAQRQPGGMGRGGITASMLMTQKSVQEELKMSDDQIAKVEKVNKDIREKFGAEMKDSFKDKEKMADLMKKMSAETTKALADVLKPEQTKRLKQIEIQLGGLNALTSDEVSKALSLSDKQISDAKAMAEDLNKDRGEIMKEAGKDKDKRAEATEKVAKLTKETTAKFLDKLSADQKKTYTAMIGEEFKGKITFGGGRPMKDKE